ncbi:EamA family transporter [Paenibacillus polymyxa]|uniref:EamA family transporter n=1 Tax=Paenibacillus polymyxa TaxID=1406 RepID=UPI0004D3900D|nr:EamA family transporter [Paenibacillus polymyxa]KAF6634920.1 EamA family transporter [Paenibacillus sp. EKM208P]KEO78520.1 membrane protein [Paenibacillus polymyxa]MCH6188208.1 EamA family transporter [Paenibacillus polymyxa]MDY8092217.1 EamA family transporter [Paenibacillus polymyxa]WRL57673.1 EamA family transporter [Paenibacillus polymyxa]
MKFETLVSYLLLLLNILMLVSGQAFFKLGLDKMGGVTINNAWKALLSPTIIIGLVLYAIATLVWFVVLSRIPLSTAYPIQSLAYVLGILLASWIFHEPISPVKWTGAIIIIIGVLFIAVEK